MLLNLLLTLNINELKVHYMEGAFNLLYAAVAGGTSGYHYRGTD